MHLTSHVDPLAATTPHPYQDHSSGFRRTTYVDRSMGSVHMGAGVCFLEPGGRVDSHLHSFEESLYVLEGGLELTIHGAVHALEPGHYALIRTGVRHAVRNAGRGMARWLEMHAPQPRPAGYSCDTFFVNEGGAEDPAVVGRFDESQLPRPGGPSQMEGFNPITGVAIKMFVDRSAGAIHQSLFLIQYLPGAKIDPHDHTFEESYLIVAGRVRATADGAVYDLGPGDTIWTGVGCIHSFENVGTEPVRWIETQAPLPPAKEVFRFERDWARFSASAG